MEYTIFILLLPLLSFLVLGIGGKWMTHRTAGIIGTTVLAVVAVLSYATAWQYFSAPRLADGTFATLMPYNVTWLPFTSTLSIDLGILLDPISVMMLIVISTVSLMVHVYSFGYMKGERGFQRYYEVLPNFTNRDRLIDSALGSLNIAIIPIVLSISMICCVTFFYKKKLSKPIKLLTNAYHKIEANDLDFTLSYPLNDEMGKLCHAFEKMKDCLSKNNETMFRQFAEQRRLNAAFSHDLRTPLTLLKGHATMLLSFIPKGLVSQQEILDEISVMSKNISCCDTSLWE